MLGLGVTLVVVDSTLRLSGGGDTAPARELDLFIAGGPECRLRAK
jgi:hypothetical protein